MMFHLAFVCALAGIAFGQDYKEAEHLGLHESLTPPNPFGPWKPVDVVGEAGGCCFHKEMEVLEGMMLAEVNKGRPTIIMGNLWVSVSTRLRKTFSHVYLNVNGRPMEMKIWQDYSSSPRTQYVLHKNGTCMKSPLGPWNDICIPASAHMLGNAYFGNQIGPNKINSTWYAMQVNNTIAYISVTPSSTPNVCIPVTESAYGSAKGVPFSLSVDYMNQVPKVRDYRVFTVPSVCTHDDVEWVPEVDVFGGSMLHR